MICGTSFFSDIALLILRIAIEPAATSFFAIGKARGTYSSIYEILSFRGIPIPFTPSRLYHVNTGVLSLISSYAEHYILGLVIHIIDDGGMRLNMKYSFKFS